MSYPALRRSEPVLPPARPATHDGTGEGSPDLTELPPARRPAHDDAVTGVSSDSQTDGTAADQPRDGTGEKPHGKRQGQGRDGLTPDQERVVSELQVRDRQVRAHEAAHQAAGGGLTGGASFTYEVGPDGQSYAIGGEVPVDLSSGRTPDETIARAQRVRAAAMAPADPSAADFSVAAAASELEASARRQMSLERVAAMASALSRPVPTKSDANESTGAFITDSNGSTDALTSNAQLESNPIDAPTDANMVYARLESASLATPASSARLAALARVAYGVS